MPRLSKGISKHSSIWLKEPLPTIKEIEIPTCRDGWVTIKPAYYSRSGKTIPFADNGKSTDDHCDGRPVSTRAGNSRVSNPSKRTRHVYFETAGTVEEVGLGVSQFAKGQRVVSMPSKFSDDSLDDHENGERQCAIKSSFMDSNAIFSAPSSYFYPLPASISLQSATHLAALATAYHALLHISPFRPFDNVLIVSSNCVSLFLIRLLSIQNALQIIVVEQNPLWKRLATQFGATHVLDPGDMDIPESVRLLTDDMGADSVFQISGQCDYEPAHNIASSTGILKRTRARSAVSSSTITACRTRGTIVNIAPRKMYEAGKSEFRNELMMHEVQYMRSAGYNFASLKAAVGLMERGEVEFEGISPA